MPDDHLVSAPTSRFRSLYFAWSFWIALAVYGFAVTARIALYDGRALLTLGAIITEAVPAAIAGALLGLIVAAVLRPLGDRAPGSRGPVLWSFAVAFAVGIIAALGALGVDHLSGRT